MKRFLSFLKTIWRSEVESPPPSRPKAVKKKRKSFVEDPLGVRLIAQLNVFRRVWRCARAITHHSWPSPWNSIGQFLSAENMPDFEWTPQLRTVFNIFFLLFNTYHEFGTMYEDKHTPLLSANLFAQQIMVASPWTNSRGGDRTHDPQVVRRARYHRTTAPLN